MKEWAILLLGSNVGDSVSHLRQARKKVEEKIGYIVKRSRIYRSSPWGVKGHEDYLNQAILLYTKFSPKKLMKKLLSIEKDLGRKRTETVCPRTIDIDILFYDRRVIEKKKLIIPHQRLHLRRFALIPLCDIAPHFVHPVLKKSMKKLLKKCKDKGIVIPIEDN